MDVKKKRKKKRKREKKEKKKYRKNVCVCLNVFMDIFFRIKLQGIKKDLIFWLDQGVEVQTCTEVVFLKSDEKIKFLKLL